MKHIILRILAACLGMLAALDGILPAHTETLLVTHHSEDFDGDGHAYHLHFAHAHPTRCTVTQAGFRQVGDGQRIGVQSSALARLCTGIIVDGRPLAPPLQWQITRLCVLAVCLGIACFPQRRKRRLSA